MRWRLLALRRTELNQAGLLVVGDDALLVIDDTAVPKKAERSVDVAEQ
ncbi:SRSO17 transposase [Bradyrhizobium sp. AZCC 1693]